MPPPTLIGALPSSTRPPQSPGAREPTAWSLVKTIGHVGVPLASIRESLRNTRFARLGLPLVPLMTVPGWILMVTPASTCTVPPSVIVHVLGQVWLAVITPWGMTTVPPGHAIAGGSAGSNGVRQVGAPLTAGVHSNDGAPK